MIAYGAQVLTRANLEAAIEDIPAVTSRSGAVLSELI
jgi:hypothetical protein